jgi:hypothetical protein
MGTGQDGHRSASVSLPPEDYEFVAELMRLGDRPRSWVISRIIQWLRIQTPDAKQALCKLEEGLDYYAPR